MFLSIIRPPSPRVVASVKGEIAFVYLNIVSSSSGAPPPKQGGRFGVQRAGLPSPDGLRGSLHLPAPARFKRSWLLLGACEVTLSAFFSCRTCSSLKGWP
ncbi:Hypothetical predicted protein [Marmota monax]|uniref:Uncharacterized protein n=1 Tax=Marmota monax TaxID=9995 RepID=A0A5E4C393_MARMO|nr:hypothetical protein GHT09_012682 [Marmota monax]VTJ75352.1 Hypothetical predicted protein [Marmota monax]